MKVDLPQFRQEVENILFSASVKAKYQTGKDGDKYYLKSEKFTYEITLSDNFIGYDLRIFGGADSLDVSMGEDSDNYPIYGEPEEGIAAGIFLESVRLMKEILNKKVLYWQGPKANVMATRIDDSKYLVKRGKKNFLGFYSSVTEEVSLQNIEQMNLRILA